MIPWGKIIDIGIDLTSGLVKTILAARAQSAAEAAALRADAAQRFATATATHNTLLSDLAAQDAKHDAVADSKPSRP